MFAANLVHWLKRLCLPVSYHAATLETIRTDVLVLPAKLVRASKKNVFKLPGDYHYQKEPLEAERSIAHLRLPETFRLCKYPHRR